MPALRDTRRDAGQRHIDIVQRQEDQLYRIARLPPARDHVRIGQSGQRGLEGEALAPGDMLPDGFQHQSPCLERRLLGREGRKSGGDQIGIDEDRTTRLVGQKLAGEGGFPRAIGPGDDDDALGKHLALEQRTTF